MGGWRPGRIACRLTAALLAWSAVALSGAAHGQTIGIEAPRRLPPIDAPALGPLTQQPPAARPLLASAAAPISAPGVASTAAAPEAQRYAWIPSGGAHTITPHPSVRAGAAPPVPSQAPWMSGAPHDQFCLRPSYRYNGAGGYLHVATPNEQYSINLQNQLTLDGTFYDQSDMPTDQKGFCMPFTRTYLFGNITPEWQYQVATQAFLGQFNILDGFVNWHWGDEFNVRIGRGLSPMLYEYYAFSPAWEPVITNSVVFQLAGRRQEGVMLSGNVLDGTLQYQAGVFNGVSGAFFDLDRSVDFIGSATVTPWAGTNSAVDCLGLGVSVQTGQHNYALNQTGSAWTNGAGEPSTNINYITSSGVPFFEYNQNTAADGTQSKVAPHFFWYGRFSVLAEYLYSTRQLALGATRGSAVQQGYYVNASYFLTGERYHGNGLAGYTTVMPLRPFLPSRGLHGPGAWEVAAQFSQLRLDDDNFRFVTTPNRYASRVDQLMIGVNWWPTRYVRMSLDNVFTWFDRAIPLGDNAPTDQFNTVWCRAAMFF